MYKYKDLLRSIKDDTRKITVDRFFSGAEAAGYLSKKEFLDYLQSTNSERKLLKGLETLFKCFSERYTVNNLPIEYEDIQGRPYMWMVLSKGNSLYEFKLLTNPGVLRFIDDYRLGRITPSLSFYELNDSAHSASTD